MPNGYQSLVPYHTYIQNILISASFLHSVSLPLLLFFCKLNQDYTVRFEDVMSGFLLSFYSGFVHMCFLDPINVFESSYRLLYMLFTLLSYVLFVVLYKIYLLGDIEWTFWKIFVIASSSFIMFLFVYYGIQSIIIDNKVEHTCIEEECEHVPCFMCGEENIDYITELSCKHSFHSVCIQKWFTKSVTCPICRSFDV